jgi:hypothetical protein
MNIDAAGDSETIDIDDEDTVEVLEVPEESAEAQLSMYHFIFLPELVMILN